MKHSAHDNKCNRPDLMKLLLSNSLVSKTKHFSFVPTPALQFTKTQQIQNSVSLLSIHYKYNKCWSHIAPCSRLYLVKLKVVIQLKSQQ